MRRIYLKSDESILINEEVFLSLATELLKLDNLSVFIHLQDSKECDWVIPVNEINYIT